MAYLNKVMLIGRLTRDPDPPRTLPSSGNTVISFGFAVGRRRKNPQTGQWENDPNPLFIDCEAFARPDTRRNMVELISQYARKGSQVFIEGRLQLDQWDDKTTGQKRSKHRIVVENLELLDPPPSGSMGPGGDDHGEMDAPPPPPRGNFGNRGAGRPPARPAPPPDEMDDAGGSGDIPF